ncbi:MAG: ABC transporter ATP-binding protein [Chloroflexi bacterium]|nr:ABC transporter ATP-binding protein [Chloroflexota bacterium]
MERLETHHLSYRYPGSDRGISDISLTLARGSFTVVTGRVGAGKTTLLRVLLGLLPMDSGRLAWNGRGVADPGGFLVPPRCAYTPQVPRLFSERLRDNILLGLPEDRVSLDRAIWQAVLERDVGELDQGLDTVVGPRGIRLSGGQVQRAAAARMFVADTELIVVDDLSSALDVETERALWERLSARPTVASQSIGRRPIALPDRALRKSQPAQHGNGSIASLVVSSACGALLAVLDARGRRRP